MSDRMTNLPIPLKANYGRSPNLVGCISDQRKAPKPKKTQQG